MRRKVTTPEFLAGSDDFQGTSLNTSLWGVYNGTNPSSGEVWNSQQVVVENDCLNLTASPAGLAGVAGKTQFTYGTFEVRARFLPTFDSLLNPVFLFWPQLDSSWPAAGEIDFVECYDITRQSYQSWNHYANSDGQNTSDYAGTTTLDMTQWHVYRVEWAESSIVLMIDGVEWHTYTQHIPSGPMHVVFQIDGKGKVSGATHVQIDYFHVLS